MNHPLLPPDSPSGSPPDSPPRHSRRGDDVNRRWREFSQRKTFPGTDGGPFDKILHAADAVQRVPGVVLAGLLLGLAIIPFYASPFLALLFWAVYLGDWLLLHALPWAGRSFGPAKPPVLLLALLRLPFAFLPGPWAWVMQGVGTLLVVYGFWVEPHRLRVTRQSLRSNKILPGARLRLLHLADLHVERMSPRERQLDRLIAELKPDVIVFTGDFLSLSRVHDRESWADVRSIVERWHAPRGVYVVTGSPPVDDPNVVPHLLAQLPHVRRLRDEHVTLTEAGVELGLLGLDCTHMPHVDGPRLAQLMAGTPPSQLTVLLYHSPDLAPFADELGVDLMLSGHTHGGQVRLPWLGALYASSLYGKRFQAGRYALDRTTLYVSRGIGMEGKGAPRVRFLCPPEVVLWEIGGQDPA
jgi:uncharacterized protein